MESSLSVVSANQHPSTAALEAAVATHWDAIVAALTRLTGDPQEAQDLALETFWRYYTRPPQHEDNLGGWLYRIALRLGWNAIRANRRRQTYEQQAGLEQSAPADPADEAERSAEAGLVRSVLAAMQPRKAQALLLRSAGLSYKEVAAALDMPASSVGQLLLRAEAEFAQRYHALHSAPAP